jgi:hypothetical protein
MEPSPVFLLAEKGKRQPRRSGEQKKMQQKRPGEENTKNTCGGHDQHKDAANKALCWQDDGGSSGVPGRAMTIERC